MKPHVLKRETIINSKIDDVFGFFSNASNLNKITPGNLNFRILPPLPDKIEKGTILNYELMLLGIRIKWRTEITSWEPPYFFSDKQTTGPYKVWVHEHRFEEMGDNTIMSDTVHYLSPGGILEFIPHFLFVKKRVESIFDYRTKIINKLFQK